MGNAAHENKGEKSALVIKCQWSLRASCFSLRAY